MFDLCVYLFAWSGEGVVHVEPWAAGWVLKEQQTSEKSQMGNRAFLEGEKKRLPFFSLISLFVDL